MCFFFEKSMARRGWYIYKYFSIYIYTKRAARLVNGLTVGKKIG